MKITFHFSFKLFVIENVIFMSCFADFCILDDKFLLKKFAV